MSDIKRLLTVIQQRKKITPALFEKASAKLPSATLRKVQLYQRSDKRLNVDILISDIRSYTTKKGGASGTEDKEVKFIKIKETDGDEWHDIGILRKLGEGSFAEAWECVDGSVVKIFKASANPETLEHARKNLEEFGGFHPMPYQTSFMNDVVDLFDVQGSAFAYFTKKCDSDMSALFDQRMDGTTIHMMEVCLRILKHYAASYAFVHSDMKLENILRLREPNNVNRAFVHDWDGVYIYDTRTLNHIVPLDDRRIICSPKYVHPFWAYYILCREIYTHNGGQVPLTKIIIDNVEHHLRTWTHMLRGCTFGNLLAQFISKVKYDEYISQHLRNKTEEQAFAFIQAMLAACDRYSLATSILANIILNKAKFRDGTPEEEQLLGDLKNNAVMLAAECLRPYKSRQMGGNPPKNANELTRMWSFNEETASNLSACDELAKTHIVKFVNGEVVMQVSKQPTVTAIENTHSPSKRRAM